jgi:hypothetical protein
MSYHVDMTGALAQLRKLSFGAIAGACLMLGLCFAIGAWRFARAASRAGAKMTAGEFFKNIIPLTLLTLFLAHGFSLLSEAVRVRYLMQHAPDLGKGSVVVALADRAFGLGTTVIVAGIALVVFPALPTIIRVAGLMTAAAGMVVLWFAMRGAILSLPKRLGGDQLDRILRLFVPDERAIGELMAIAVTSSAVFGLAVFAVSWDLGIGLPVFICLLAGPVVCASMSVPLTFAGLGAREAAVVGLLGWTGLASLEQAMALSFALGACVLLVSAAGLIRGWRIRVTTGVTPGKRYDH